MSWNSCSRLRKTCFRSGSRSLGIPPCLSTRMIRSSEICCCDCFIVCAAAFGSPSGGDRRLSPASSRVKASAADAAGTDSAFCVVVEYATGITIGICPCRSGRNSNFRRNTSGVLSASPNDSMLSSRRAVGPPTASIALINLSACLLYWLRQSGPAFLTSRTTQGAMLSRDSCDKVLAIPSSTSSV